jgi:hypothetical protein
MPREAKGKEVMDTAAGATRTLHQETHPRVINRASSLRICKYIIDYRMHDVHA